MRPKQRSVVWLECDRTRNSRLGHENRFTNFRAPFVALGVLATDFSVPASRLAMYSVLSAMSTWLSLSVT